MVLIRKIIIKYSLLSRALSGALKDIKPFHTCDTSLIILETPGNEP